MSRIRTKQHQYSLCASPTRVERKNKRLRSNKELKEANESESDHHLIYHTLRVPVINSIPMAKLAIGKKKPTHSTTLRRKRQIRDILSANNEGYSDDFFDSTPVRNRKPITYPIIDVLVKDPELDVENDSDLFHRVSFHGTNSSPTNIHCLFASPPTLSASVKRKNADIIVLRMQKSKRYRKYVCQATPKASAITRSNKVINGSVFDNPIKRDDENSSSEDDNYFSDIEDE